MALNKELINKIITVTSKAAISCHKFVGKNDKKSADKAATDTMRDEINKIEFNGQVVIGEGELDEAPMLYIGEKLGSGGNLDIDIAVDPLEGTNFVARNLPGALKRFPFSAIEITERAPGKFFATKFVPSRGSTAISISIFPPEPNFSPIYNIGASSSSPSPITT